MTIRRLVVSRVPEALMRPRIASSRWSSPGIVRRGYGRFQQYRATVPRLARLAAAAATGYLAGTLPSADLAARLATGGAADLRTTGSGNPGAANAINVLGP